MIVKSGKTVSVLRFLLPCRFVERPFLEENINPAFCLRLHKRREFFCFFIREYPV